MKKLKKVLLPAVIVLMGAGAAFATNVAKNSNDDLPLGYYFDSSEGKCVTPGDHCALTGGEYCSWSEEDGSSSHDLFQINETTCTTRLYKVSQ